ncbi:MAG: FecR domain-containing protein [Halieaceae bacterium]
MKIARWKFFFLIALFLLPIQTKASEWVYVVSEGDSLWDISQTYLGTATSWTKVQKLNQLPDPNWVKPGTRLRIPLAWITQNSVGALVKALSGNCSVIRSDGTEEELRPGDKLSLGDRVQTFSESTVSVEFADRSVVTLDSNSELVLDHLSAYGATGMVDSRMRLLKGRLETKVTSANGPGSRFEIHTTAAISAVRGTKYRMAAVEGESSSRFEVTGGIVDVSNPEAKGKVILNRGFGSVVSKGQMPLPPQALLPAPDLVEIPQTLNRMQWPIAWNPVDKAKKYRIRLSDSQDFETVIWQSVTDQARVKLPTLVDGKYYLRVRAIDEIGLEGMERETTLLQAANPQPPVAIAPAASSIHSKKFPDLSWSQAPGANLYHLQVARDAEFTDIVIDQSSLEGLQYSPAASAELGVWYWRVASIDLSGHRGPFGPVSQFIVTEEPPTAQLDYDDATGNIKVFWPSADSGVSYQVQIAHDREFNKIISDETLTESEYTLPTTKREKRYLRIRTIDLNGQKSEWTTAQEIATESDESWKIVLGVILTMVLIAL